MASSNAKTVAAYLAELPADRRATLAAVRRVVRKHLPRGYRETMNWGLISYELPLRTHPDTYNGKPLCYAGLAAQKHFTALYLTPVHMDPALARQLREGFRKAGKRLNMGKSCIRFQRPEDLALDVVARVVASTPPERLIAFYARGARPRKEA